MGTHHESDRRRSQARLWWCAAWWLSWPMALPAQPDVYIYPAGCFDAYGRPLKPDPANPALSTDAACQPPASGALVRGSRSGVAPAAGAPSMQPGSINLPPTPVPVPGGMGVMSP